MALTAGSSAQSLTRLRGVAAVVVVVVLAVLFFFARLTRLDVVTAASWCVVSASCHALSRAHTRRQRRMHTHSDTFHTSGACGCRCEAEFPVSACRPSLSKLLFEYQYFSSSVNYNARLWHIHTHTHTHAYTACLMLHVARIQACTGLAWPGLDWLWLQLRLI